MNKYARHVVCNVALLISNAMFTARHHDVAKQPDQWQKTAMLTLYDSYQRLSLKRTLFILSALPCDTDQIYQRCQRKYIEMLCFFNYYLLYIIKLYFLQIKHRSSSGLIMDTALASSTRDCGFDFHLGWDVFVILKKNYIIRQLFNG